MLKVIKDAKENDDDFDHVYLGQPKDDDESAIIKRSHIMAAIAGHIKLNIEPKGSRRSIRLTSTRRAEAVVPTLCGRSPACSSQRHSNRRSNA